MGRSRRAHALRRGADPRGAGRCLGGRHLVPPLRGADRHPDGAGMGDHRPPRLARAVRAPCGGRHVRGAAAAGRRACRAGFIAIAVLAVLSARRRRATRDGRARPGAISASPMSRCRPLPWSSCAMIPPMASPPSCWSCSWSGRPIRLPISPAASSAARSSRPRISPKKTWAGLVRRHGGQCPCGLRRGQGAGPAVGPGPGR